MKFRKLHLFNLCHVKLLDMEKTVLISMPVEDLQSLIIECVRTGLKYTPQPGLKPQKTKLVPINKDRSVKKEVPNG